MALAFLNSKASSVAGKCKDNCHDSLSFWSVFLGKMTLRFLFFPLKERFYVVPWNILNVLHKAPDFIFGHAITWLALAVVYIGMTLYIQNRRTTGKKEVNGSIYGGESTVMNFVTSYYTLIIPWRSRWRYIMTSPVKTRMITSCQN